MKKLLKKLFSNAFFDDRPPRTRDKTIKHCDACKEWEYECICYMEAEMEAETGWKSSGLTRKELEHKYKQFKKKMEKEMRDSLK